jgi:hypothetical protein
MPRDESPCATRSQGYSPAESGIQQKSRQNRDKYTREVSLLRVGIHCCATEILHTFFFAQERMGMTISDTQAGTMPGMLYRAFLP